ncbi:TRAP transporter large permease subunit [Microvirga sp. W0021]|uniref:TRAP transporter large permease subunit n=1 Tax=Hohaiivirga grylli TaxID=3133970 RepID=A0ABV0BI56_9HYPH
MLELIAHNLAPLMFASLIVFLLLGYPVAFSLAANGLIFFFIALFLTDLVPGSVNVQWPLLQALPDRMFEVMKNEVMLAIPFFTFMGLVLERSGMAEDLLDTIGQVFGTIRGGLAYAVIFVGALLAATTGVVAASVISMGLISLPIMLRYGYDRRLASGVIAAAGTLAQIIPPSLVLIILGDQLGRSVGDMYKGAFIPGLTLAGLYALWIFISSIIFPKSAPGLPVDAIGHREPSGARGLWQLGILVLFSGYYADRIVVNAGISSPIDVVIISILIAAIVAFTCSIINRFLGSRYVLVTLALTLVFGWAFYTMQDGSSFAKVATIEILLVSLIYALIAGILERFFKFRLISRIAEQVTFVMVPPLFLIFLVLGTIILQIATPTEGGAMGAIGALLMAAFKRWSDKNPARFNWQMLRQATESTAKLATFAMFILLGARVFSLTFFAVEGRTWVENLLTSLPGGETGFILFVMVFVFVLAFFLDYFELAFIVIPLLVPTANALGIDLVWFGVMLAVNMQTSFLHPPFGFSLFFLRSVAPTTAYQDRVTGTTIQPVTTGQIYWGAIPFLCIQILMIGILFFFPGMVTHYKDSNTTLAPAAIQQQLDNMVLPDMEGPGGDGGLDGLDIPPPPSF